MKKNNHTKPSAAVLRAGRALPGIAFCLLASSATVSAQDASPAQVTTPAAAEEIIVLDAMDVEAGGDPNFIVPNQPIQSVVGFSKNLVDTPRSVSVVSAEMLSSMAIAEVSDLSRIVPSANTTTRWGIQGNIDIRNMTADTYFRGMKRIEPQGNSRTVLAANDQVEVVRGPAPAYFGSGKIGGYTNMTPKSGRSRAGAYLEESTGFAELTVGDYGKRIASFGYGGALKGKNPELAGGYYVFALVEDSDSYYEHVPIGQRVYQGAISKEISKAWRVETGINYQETEGAGGFLTRITQDLVDNGNYWAGRPLVNLDADASGKISEREMVLGSPVGGVFGAGNANNRALAQRFGPGTKYATAAASPIVPTGAGANANSALAALFAANPAFVATMEADPARYGTNLKMLNVLPQGFVMDPASTQLTQADYNHVSLEKELLAKLGLFYFDLINDRQENVKYKNQILFDSQDQFKNSELPFAQEQDIWVVEDKFTVEYKLPDASLPDWLTINSISSVSARYTNASRIANTGDYDDRPDLSLPGNVRTPFDTFVTPYDNPDYFNGGAAYSSDINTTYSETGVGSMLDIGLGERLNLLLGGRLDYIQAETTVPAGLYVMGTDGTVTTPAQARAASGEGDDFGKSYTISLSGKGPFGLVPYVTYAKQTALSDGADLTLAGNLVRAGAYDAAQLEEIGLKGTFFGGKLYTAVAAYRQKRSTVTSDPGGNPLVGGLGNVSGEGIELEARWAPNKNFWMGAFSVFQKTELIFDANRFVRVHGEELGFTDVLDGAGNVIYPAEAFTWGGQATVPVGPTEKTESPSYPNTSHGLQAQYTFDNGFSVSGSGNYISEVHSGRVQKVILPEALTFNMGVGYKSGDWAFKLDVKNVTDEQYFRGRNGDTAGDVLISAMPGRSYQVVVTKAF